MVLKHLYATHKKIILEINEDFNRLVVSNDK
jgi:hypothetical protein